MNISHSSSKAAARGVNVAKNPMKVTPNVPAAPLSGAPHRDSESEERRGKRRAAETKFSPRSTEQQESRRLRYNVSGAVRNSGDVQCWPWVNSSKDLKRICANGDDVIGTQSYLYNSANLRLQQHKVKSNSLGCGNEAAGSQSFFKVRSRSLTFFQRLGGLRRSFSTRSSHQRSPRQTQPNIRNHCDQDWVFFRGFSGKRREDLQVEPFSVCHGSALTIPSCSPVPQAPPRRKRPKRQIEEDNLSAELHPLRRSLSFTDAHFIAQAVYEGDRQLIEELYPDFPRSTPIYAVVDLSKKKKFRNNKIRQSHPSASPIHNESQQTATIKSRCDSENKSENNNSHCSAENSNKGHPPLQPSCSKLTPIPGSDRSSEEKEEEGGANRPADFAAENSEISVAAASNVVTKPTLCNARAREEKTKGVGLSVNELWVSSTSTSSPTKKTDGTSDLVRRNGAGPNSSDDRVTLTNSVMFVKQSPDLHSRMGKGPSTHGEKFVNE